MPTPFRSFAMKKSSVSVSISKPLNFLPLGPHLGFTVQQQIYFLFMPSHPCHISSPACYQFSLGLEFSFFPLVHASHSQTCLTPFRKFFPTALNFFNHPIANRSLNILLSHHFNGCTTPLLGHSHLLKPERFLLITLHALKLN